MFPAVVSSTDCDIVYNSSFLFADAADAASAAVTAEEDIVDAPVDAAAAELAERTCPECGNLFKNDRGVSMHMSKMHKGMWVI